MSEIKFSATPVSSEIENVTVTLSPLEVKESEAMLDKPLKIQGVLAIPRVSRNRNLYLPSELEQAIKWLKGQYIPVYLEHVDVSNVVGKASLTWNPEKLQVEFIGYIYDKDVADKIKAGLIKHVSLGADYERIDEIDGLNVVRGLRFRELSLVAVPGIPEANIRVVEKDNSVIMTETEIKLKEKIEKVVPFKATKKAPEERGWDKNRAIRSLRKWASSDGSGDKDKINWAKYRQGFAWYDPDHADDFGGYKLPHHEVIDGELCVVWRGVAAAMAALMGARGGVQIPDKDRRGVYNHLAKHYKQFDKQPPSFEAVEKLAKADDINKAVNELSDEDVKAVAEILDMVDVDLGKNTLPGKAEDEMTEKVQPEKVEEKVEEKTEEKVEKPIENKIEVHVDTKPIAEKLDELKKLIEPEKEKTLPTHVEEAEEKVEEKVEERYRKIYEAITNIPTGYAWNVDPYVVPAALPLDLTKYVEVKTLRKGQASAKFYSITALTFSKVTEGTAPSPASQSVSTVTVTPDTYEVVQEYTDKDLREAEIDIVGAIEKAMALGHKKTVNDLIIDAVDSDDVSNVVYGGDAEDESSVDSSDTMSFTTLIKAKQKILDGHIACEVGELVCIMSTKQYYDLLVDSNVTKILNTDNAPFVKDALEQLLGIEIVVSDQVNTGTGSGGITTYHAVLFKKNEAVGLAVERDLRIESQRVADALKTKLVGSFRMGAKVKIPAACCKIITA